LKDLEENVEQPKQELEERLKEDERRLRKIESLQHEIDGLKRDLDSLMEEMSRTQAESQEPYNNRLREIQLQLADLKNEAQQKSHAIEKLQLEKEDLVRSLRHQREKADSRLMLLQQRNRDAYEAIMWLRRNQDRFRSPIIEPIILVTNCTSREYLPQVESAIRGRDMFSFVAQCKEDLHLFMTEVHDKMKLKVNGVTAPERSLATFSPELPVEQLRSFGFKRMLLDYIDAPEPVLKYLCGRYYVHNIPISGELNADQIEHFERSLPRTLRSLRYFAGKNDFTVMRSRFADHMISRSREISNPEFLTHQVNMSEVERLEAEIRLKEDEIAHERDQWKHIRDQDDILRQEDSEIRKKKSHVMTLRQRKRTLMGNIEHRETKVEQMRRNVIDIDAEKEKCKVAVKDAQKERVKAIDALTHLLCEYVGICEALAKAVACHVQAECERDILVKRCRESEESLKRTEGECKQLQDTEKLLKDTAKRLLDVARRETGVSDPEKLSMELKKKFDEYPSGLAELEEQIHHFQAKADLCSGIDPRVVDDYKRREREIDELGKKIEEKQGQMDQKGQEMETVKTEWRSSLDQQLEEINDKFSGFFKEMGCAGQVSLNDQGSDYANYGIDIKVKFRDTETLQLLTSQRQSGGERSVSTMLYLLALQDMTKCPFRAVDEINQGMDPVNERKVFNLIVDSVSGRSTAQYFLFTPKLLHGLSFGPHVTVHCIHNGPEMLDFKSFNIRKFLRGITGTE
jgi:chromosome segregation ATPase